jgi:hypothetical protein
VTAGDIHGLRQLERAFASLYAPVIRAWLRPPVSLLEEWKPRSDELALTRTVSERTLVLMLDRVVHLRDCRPAEWRVTYSLDQENLARLLAILSSGPGHAR